LHSPPLARKPLLSEAAQKQSTTQLQIPRQEAKPPDGVFAAAYQFFHAIAVISNETKKFSKIFEYFLRGKL
jgi:hypothetical protein